MASPPPRRAGLSFFLEDLQLDRSSGILDIEDGKARLYFADGMPVHAVVMENGDLLEGEAALDAIIRRYGNTTRAVFSSGAAVPAHTLECSVDDLQHRLNPADGAAPGEPATQGTAAAARGPHLGEPGYQPLLPHGHALFDAIPLGALVIEALAPTLRDGAIIVSGPHTVGVVLVRGGALDETFLFQEDQRSIGSAALVQIRALTDASVSAYALDSALVDCVPTLLRGTPSYQDLHLAWTDWKALIADLMQRPGTHIVEVETPRGRGVACIRDGQQIGSYTDQHPLLGDLSLLDELIAGREGTIWIRTPAGPVGEAESRGAAPLPQSAPAPPPSPAAAAPEPAPAEPATAPATASAPAESAPVPADILSPPMVVEQPAAVMMPPHEAPAPWPAQQSPVAGPLDGELESAFAAAPTLEPLPPIVPVEPPWGAPPPQQEQTMPAPAGEFAAPAPEALQPVMPPAPPSPSPEPTTVTPLSGNPLEHAFSDIFSAGAPDLGAPMWPPAPESGLPVWPPPAGSTPPRTNGAHPDQLDSSVGQLLPAFKQIARARLQRSALRVETMLDDAAEQGRPVEAVLAEIRGLTIRGVMQSTLDQVVDEMMAVALEHHQ